MEIPQHPTQHGSVGGGKPIVPKDEIPVPSAPPMKPSA